MTNSVEFNRTFKTAAGKVAKVFQEFTTGRNATGFAGRNKCVRTWVEVEGDERQFDCDAGCSFQAERVVRQGQA